MKIDNDKLNLAMARKGMYLKDLCKEAGISEPPFRAVRQGKAKPRPATIGKIATALGVEVEDIIEGEGD